MKYQRYFFFFFTNRKSEKKYQNIKFKMNNQKKNFFIANNIFNGNKILPMG